jgi:ABC-2 type transport system ATP-binding protein
VVEKICSHLIILRKGQVIAHGTTGEVREEIGKPSLEGVFLQLVAEGDVAKVAEEIADVVSSP